MKKDMAKTSEKEKVKRRPNYETKFGKLLKPIMMDHPILMIIWDTKVKGLSKIVNDKEIIKSIMEDWEYQASITWKSVILPYSTTAHVKLKTLKF